MIFQTHHKRYAYEFRTDLTMYSQMLEYLVTDSTTGFSKDINLDFVENCIKYKENMDSICTLVCRFSSTNTCKVYADYINKLVCYDV